MAAFKAERKQIWKAKKARMDDGWGFAGAGEKKKERPKVSAPGPLPWKAPAVRKAADASTKPALQGSLPGESSRARLSQTLFGERKAAAARTSQEPPEERAAQAAAHTRPQRGGFASPGEESDEEASASQADSQAESEERDLDYGHHPASAHARSVRYVRIVGNSAHPEVEELVRRTLQELGGWEEERDDEEDQDASLQLTSRSSTPAAGGKPASSGRPQLWNLMWSWSARVPVSYDALLVWQRVNHYPEARQLTRKDLLQRHLARHQRVFAGGRAAPLFDIMPTTFMLPKEYVQFVQAFSEAEGGQEASIPQPPGTNLWIMKPVGQSRGRGIVLLNNVHDVLYGEPMVLQRYVAQPMLIDGYKFDLRLYVVVTSFAPLEAWLYGEGFARFTTQPYSLAPDLIHNRLVHLTNSAVQSQRGAQAGLPDHLHGNEQHLAGDSKCSLARLWGLLRDRGMSQEALWSRISQLVLVALFAVQDAIPHQPNSFELFGFDVMVDSNLKAWLVEVNSSPSLSTDTPLDREIKGSLMRDLITLVNPLDFDREALLRVLQRDSAAGSKAHGPASRRPLGRTQSTANRRQTLNDDMTAILRGQLPRAYGEAPQCGLFQQLAPSKAYDSMMRLKRPMQTPSQ
ncbi:hypothetical protein WJX72_001737 [[Myrmecia] bisecta]|uniref:Uncharacterized protein n=1 Tax=[Myrmecia] bisecta TaxID=41462 RepID=A0AAW1QEB3_9CHLO